MKAILILNPAAGRAAGLASRCDALLRVCREAGWQASLVETGPDPGSAAQLARQAVAQGAQLVLSCGGDGTMHGVLQGVAGTGAELGVLPFGTANALARNLQLPLEPVAALRALLAGKPRSLPLGWAENAEGRRWFAVLAGAGPDGALVEAASAHAASKARWGRSAYYGRALRLFLTRRFSSFDVKYRLVGSAEWTRTQAAGVLVGRVPDLGGLFRRVCTESRLEHGHLQAQIVRAPARLGLAAWIGMSHLRMRRWNPWLRTVEVEELRCLPAQGAPVSAQVDGEAFGHLPLRLGMVQNALRLRMPKPVRQQAAESQSIWPRS